MSLEDDPKKYKIEKGISMPDRRHGGTSAFKRLMEDMEVGDSIVVDSHKESLVIYAYFNRHGGRTSTRKIGENEFRVWRTK